MAAMVRDPRAYLRMLGSDDPAVGPAHREAGTEAPVCQDRAWGPRPPLRRAGLPRTLLIGTAFYMQGFEEYTPQDVACNA